MATDRLLSTGDEADQAKAATALTPPPQRLDGGGEGAEDRHETDDSLGRHVQFSRSQSLPHLDKELGWRRHRPGRIRAARGSVIDRMRFFSGASARRMRTLSERTFSTIDPRDENQQRGNWDNPIEFFLTCLGYAVGLGNVWRFPYLCFTSGGGAFLIPYGIMLFGCGLPLLFMELSLGQYSSEGPLTVWKLAPMFKGLGVCMVVCSAVCAIYYNMITGWALYYLVLSIREVLPWTCCGGDWATPNCLSFASEEHSCPAPAHSSISPNQSEIDELIWGNKSKLAADEFFHNEVLGITESISHFTLPHWPLVLALLGAWVIVFCVLAKGVKSVGKTVYFTSTFPYVILIALLVNTLIADPQGAAMGMKFYLKPNFTRLAEPKVWSDAASQIFYSTGVCFGGAITLASYNRFRNNVYRDAVIVAFGNSLTSIFSGVVVFSILGSMARQQNMTVQEVATDGPGLTFITYPQSVVMFPLSPLWSFLFFTMLVTLALSTMFPTTENICTALLDQFPGTLRPYKFWVTLCLCAVFFVLGLPLTTGGGMYVLQLLDQYGVSYVLLVLGLVEIVLVAWRYGADKLVQNVELMIKRRPTVVWTYVWRFVTPGLLLFAIGFALSELKPLEYGGKVFPAWATAVGFTLTGCVLAPLPVYALYYYFASLLKNRRSHSGRGFGDSLASADIWLATLDQATSSNKFCPALAKYKVAGVEPAEDDVFA